MIAFPVHPPDQLRRPSKELASSLAVAVRVTPAQFKRTHVSVKLQGSAHIVGLLCLHCPRR